MTASKPTASLKILIAEDNRLARMGLICSLHTQQRFQVVGVACNGAEAVQLAGELQPDLVIMDIEMPLMDGIRATQQIKERFPSIKVIMLTSSTCKERVYASLIAGADSYCLKDIAVDRLHQVINAVAEGEVWLDPAFAQIIAELLSGGDSNLKKNIKT